MSRFHLSLLSYCSFVWLCASLPCQADAISGPERTTILRTQFGSFYYDAHSSNFKIETGINVFKFYGSEGCVLVEGSDASGYKLSCNDETMSVQTFHANRLEIRSKTRSITLSQSNKQFTLQFDQPPDTLWFSRNANVFTIKGNKGLITVNQQPGQIRIQSPLGMTLIQSSTNQRSISGPPLEQIPYLGRGLYIPFHGLGIFIDIAKHFPMPELASWVSWQPILE